MEFNLNEPIAKRKTKTVYRDENKTIKLFVENYSKAAILNEALIQARVEENTDLKISKLLENFFIFLKNRSIIGLSIF